MQAVWAVWAVRAVQRLVLQVFKAGMAWLPPTKAVLQLATVAVVLMKTAKLPPAATAM